jgi:GPI inositol-deacylase
MLWILPVNILVLIVWVHNLAVHWLTPFSSHHNVLSIMPFILLVETMTGGAMIPRVNSRYSLDLAVVPICQTNDVRRFRHVTYILFFSLAVYAAIYGVSYAYLLHHLANIIAAWLVGIYLYYDGFSLRHLLRILEGDDFVPCMLEDSENHVKKKP